MPEQRSQGRLRVAPERPEEIADGVPRPLHGEASSERTPDGKLLPGAHTVPSLGGKAQKGRTKLSHRIDSDSLPNPYRKQARTHRKAVCAELARDFGAGICGVVASTFARIGSIALARAEEAMDGGNAEEQRKQAALALSAFNYAREHAGKAAKARLEAGPADPHEELARVLAAEQAERTARRLKEGT